MIVAVAGGALVAGWMGPSAQAGWSPPITVLSAAASIDGPFIGFGASGRGLATGGGLGAPRGLDGRFGAAREVPGTPLLYGHDRAVVATEASRGRERLRVRVAFGSTGGRFGSARTIDTIFPSFGRSELAANDRGHVAVAYLQRVGGRRRMATLAERRTRRGFGAPRVLAGSRGASAVAVAVGGGDDLVVAWKRRGRAQARVRAAGGRMGPVVGLGPSASLIGRLRAAVSSRGAVWVAWVSTRRPEEEVFELRLAVKPPGERAFQASRLLDSEVRFVGDEADFDLALDPAGTGFVAWSASDGTQLRARLAMVGAGGEPGATHTLSTAGYGAAVRDLATSTQPGEALVTWARLDAPGELGTQVLAGLVELGGVYAGEEVVSEPDGARTPAAAFDPVSGEPTVVWSQHTALRASTRTRAIDSSVGAYSRTGGGQAP